MSSDEELIRRVFREELERFGVDISDPKSMQQDFSWTRSNRTRCENALQKVIGWGAIVVVSGVVVLFWDGVLSTLGIEKPGK